ncbi:MAG TPA: hypothetical protein VF381_08035, partial [Thermoanaerobaculia bacterium]
MPEHKTYRDIRAGTKITVALAIGCLLVAVSCLADCGTASQTVSFIANGGEHPSSVAVQVTNFGTSPLTLEAYAEVAADPAGVLPVV